MAKLGKTNKTGHLLQRSLYHILAFPDSDTWIGKIDNFIIVFLVILDVTFFILGSSEKFAANHRNWLYTVEVFVTLVFTLEYILRLWVCTVSLEFRHPLWGRLRYALHPLSIVDLMAILPFYLTILLPQIQVIRSLRILRLFRLFKLIRYSEALRMLVRVIWNELEVLVITFLAIIILLIFASSLMFFAEHNAQPDSFSSIAASMWWGVVTLTTVGYGDIYPVTTVGKIFGSVLAFLGIGMFALPAGIVASGFSEEIQKKQKQKKQRLSVLRTPTPQELTSRLEIPEQRKMITESVECSADLMRICLETAKSKFGDLITDEQVLKDLAKFLYREERRKGNL